MTVLNLNVATIVGNWAMVPLTARSQRCAEGAESQDMRLPTVPSLRSVTTVGNRGTAPLTVPILRFAGRRVIGWPIAQIHKFANGADGFPWKILEYLDGEKDSSLRKRSFDPQTGDHRGCILH